MKTTFFSFVAGIVVVCTVSCKKDSNERNEQTRLDSYTIDYTAQGVGNQVETFHVNYDAQGRITSVVSTTKPGHRFEYQYTGNDQFTRDKIEDEKVIEHNLYFINSQVSLIDSVYSYNIQKDTTSVKNFYNDNKQLVKQKQYLHSYLVKAPVWVNTVNYQYDLNGVLNKEADNYYESSYVYDEELENTVQTEPFYIPVQKRLPSITFTTKRGVTTTIKHAYTFDSGKRVTSETATASNGSITVKTYTYQEK
jgi:YD repeat-containing protein